MSRAKAIKSKDLIQNDYDIADNLLTVLFDLGATHSFISLDCEDRLGLPIFFSFDFLVSTPTSTSVETSVLCASCPISISGHSYRINLICLPLSNIDIILGMD